MAAEPEGLREFLEMMPVDQPGAQHGEAALRHLGETAVKLLGHGELQDGVTEELEPLVVGQALALFVAEGGVGERLAQERFVGERVAEAALEIVEPGGHHERC